MAVEPRAGEEDDALHWAGDDVQAAPLPTRPRAETPSAEADGVAGDAASDTAHDDRPAVPGPDVAAGEPAQLGNVALVSFGVLGGVYALFTLGWVIGGLRLQHSQASFGTDPMFLGAFWLAVFAPLAWFVTTLVLTRARPTWLRLVLLVAGAVLLVPWPFLASGTVAA